MKILIVIIAFILLPLPRLQACCPVSEIVDQGIKFTYFDSSISVQRFVVLDVTKHSLNAAQYDVWEEMVSDPWNQTEYEFGKRLLQGKFSLGNTNFSDNHDWDADEEGYSRRIKFSAPVTYNKNKQIQWPPPSSITSFPLIPLTSKLVFLDPLDRSVATDENLENGTFIKFKSEKKEYWDIYISKTDKDSEDSWGTHSVYNAEPVFYDFSCVKRRIFADMGELFPAEGHSTLIVKTSVIDAVKFSKLSVFCKNINSRTFLDDSQSSGTDENMAMILNFSTNPKCKKLEIEQEMCHSIVRFQPLEITLKYSKI